VGEDVHRGPEDALEDHVGEREGHRRVLCGAPQELAVLTDRLQDPARPAVALLEQVEQLVGRLGIGDRLRLVVDLPAFCEQLEREVAVLGEGVVVVAADLLAARLGRPRSEPGMMFTSRKKPCAARTVLRPSMYRAPERGAGLVRFTTFTLPATAPIAGP
jgi:hypothetical protein